MSETQTELEEFPRLYTIHSQKGGVGKTSIAIGIAGLAAISHNKKTLIVDADLTGTSLIDIPGFSSNSSSGSSDRYFNDLILSKPNDFNKYTHIIAPQAEAEDTGRKHLDEFYQEVPGVDNISYLPASPNLEDIQKTIPLISQEDHLLYFRSRLEDIIATAIVDGYEVIILDHPPGLYGISSASLNIVLDGKSSNQNKSRLSKLIKAVGESEDHHLSCHAIFCTTTDSVDYRAIFPSLSIILREKWAGRINDQMELDVFLNKASIEGIMDPPLVWGQILKDLRNISSYRSIDEELLNVVENRMSGRGAYVGEYNKDFSMEKILNTIQKLTSEKIERDEGLEGWCTNLSRAVKLQIITPK